MTRELNRQHNRHIFLSGNKPEKIRIICIVGTRPEAIKMAPIILKLKQQVWADVIVVATAQHREMLDTVLALFGIVPDLDLNIMKPNQTLAKLTAELTIKLDNILTDEQATVVIAQGDTTTVLAAALVSFYRKVPFYHVEAGLRSYDNNNPFPEEMNRVLVSCLANIHFAPTQNAKQALLQAGIAENKIYITGNTVIDALKQIVSQDEIAHSIALDKNKKTILVTSHRRENFGPPLRAICRALTRLIKDHNDIQIVIPVHLNPQVKSIINKELGNCERVILVPPLDYMEFVALMRDAYLILTDSGGIQEEATALGKPVLILRETTERMEGVKAGVTRLVGTHIDTIVKATSDLLNDKNQYAVMIKNALNLYGDGTAAQQIIEIMKSQFAPISYQNPNRQRFNATREFFSPVNSTLDQLIFKF